MTKKRGPTEPTDLEADVNEERVTNGQPDVADGVEMKEPSPEAGMSPIMIKGNQALEDAKGKFSVVVVVGLLENGSIDITSNLPQYPTMQWMLNRASFELLIHEKSSFAIPQEAA